MQEFIVDFDPAKGRFILAGPAWRHKELSEIPYKRRHKPSNTWHVPAVARNVDALRTKFGSARWTQLAKDALQDAELACQHRTRKQVPFPQSYPFKRNPWDHQAKGLNAGYDNEVIAYIMEMRTGKTKVLIDLYSQYFIEDRINAVLLLCPLSVRDVWVKELATDCPVAYDVHLIGENKEKALQWVTGAPYKMMKGPHTDPPLVGPHFKWLIASLESLSQGRAAKICEKFLLTHRAAMAIDESSLIKNHSATRSKEATRLSKYASHRAILNGTPTSQGIVDLYQQFEFLDPSIIGIGDFYSFRNRYCVMGGYEGRQIVGYQNEDELMKLIAPYCYEVRKSDVLKLPPKIGPITRKVKMTAAQKKAYSELEDMGVTEVAGGEVLVRNVLERMLRFQQITGGHISRVANHPWKTHRDGTPETVTEEFDIEGGNPKIEELLRIVEQTEGSMVVWCRFRREIAKVAKALGDIYGHDQVVEFHGGIDEDTRNQYKADFQAGKKRFFVGNQTVGGIGVNLSAARTVVYYSNTFSLKDRLQSLERAESADLKHSVLYLDIVMEDSVDETVMASIDNKQDMADYVKDAIRKHTIKELYHGVNQAAA